MHMKEMTSARPGACIFLDIEDCQISPCERFSSLLTVASLVSQPVKNPPAMWETQVRSLGCKDPLEKGTAIHSSILAWRIPWTV